MHQLASRLTDRFEVVVSTSMAPGAKAIEDMDGVKVFRYRYAPSALQTLVYGGGLVANIKARPWKMLLLPSYLIAWMWQVWGFRRRHGADIIHAHWLVPGALVAALTHGNVPYCITAHGTDVLGLRGFCWQRLRRLIAKDANAITAVGARVRDTLLAEGIQSVKILPMGVDLARTFHADAHIPRSSRVIYVGRLIDSKRPDHALLAFSKALQIVPELTLDVVGDGPARVGFERIAAQLGIQSKIRFHGRRGSTEIATMLRAAAALICPSGSDAAPEGLGLVAIEALGCGCPVASAPNIALQVALPATAPINFAANDSIDALSIALLAALQRPPSLTHTKPEWHKQIMRDFDWENIAHRYGDILEGLERSK
ncbi:glycosyltransferase [Stenotrophomonas sp. PS02298]|uniref:glycosyltransferase n=1 Tax=Stenotrophomonas sp. PS02298 TaxID=2991424 RepID=UPI00249AF75E|nr:glycosyltransferase [Stenotrophomonas sp. PS02298]